MPENTRRAVKLAAINDFSVRWERRALQRSPVPKSTRVALVASRDGARSPTSTSFRAHVELSAEGAFIQWSTGTARRGNNWRAHLPVEQLATWVDTVRRMQVAKLAHELAEANVSSAAWEAAVREMSDWRTHEGLKVTIRKLKATQASRKSRPRRK
jgi:hypothetical protein